MPKDEIIDTLTFDDVLRMGHVEANCLLHDIIKQEMARQDKRAFEQLGATNYYLQKMKSWREI